jgi:hypothetical protein
MTPPNPEEDHNTDKNRRIWNLKVRLRIGVGHGGTGPGAGGTGRLPAFSPPSWPGFIPAIHALAAPKKDVDPRDILLRSSSPGHQCQSAEALTKAKART